MPPIWTVLIVLVIAAAGFVLARARARGAARREARREK